MWVPRPHLVRVTCVQVSFQVSRCEITHVALKIAVDVMGMVLILDERAIDIDGVAADLPQLVDEHAKVPHKLGTPETVPGGDDPWWPADQGGSSEGIERERVVTRREDPVSGERRDSPSILTLLLPLFD